MHYPYLLYRSGINCLPLFTELSGDPFMADLSPTGPLLAGLAPRDQKAFQQRLETAMGKRYSWGLAPYLERRDTLLGDCPQMVEEQRFVHLGLDIIVALGTLLHAPLDAVVAESGYEEGEGNYGHYVLLRHDFADAQTFYSFYGHLSATGLPQAGDVIRAGQPFAAIGDFHENGNWFHHTHLQVITGAGIEKGYTTKGYCRQEDLAAMPELCPSPLPLFVLPPAGK